MIRMSIDRGQWPQLSRLLDAALDLPPAERDRWIEALDSSFDALKPDLRDLLSRASSVETRDFLNSLPAVSSGSSDSVTDAADHAGRCIGPYRLTRELGAGGMGSVWLAERTDDSVRRPVALKLPHVMSARIGLAERMVRERDILATLVHPNIARLYDAGISPEGRPYLALEYVEGVRIDRYCREQALDVQGRLRLFLQVAAAVAYAHAKLVIHRDLKPANILVTRDGEVRLLDFGVAKLLDDGRAEMTRLTELSGRALTPDYASPEQILGQSLTIASDIYSLGVVLYELLAQTRPYRLSRESRGALEEAILEVEPVRMSGVAPPGMQKALRGDLDTIVLKALRKQPEDRYATVNAFSDDVIRHLRRLPVLARPQSTWYRVSRLIARNRVTAMVVTVASIAVLVGAIVALWQARAAVAEGRRAEEVREFIATIFQEANLDSDQSRPASVLELLKQASNRVDALEAEPAVRVELLTLIGSGLLSLDDTDALENVARRAVDEGTQSLGSDHPLTVRARILMVWAHMYRGRTQEAGGEIDALMQVMTRDESAFGEELIELWRIRADQAIDAHRYEDAEAAAMQALTRAEASFGAQHPESLRALGVLSTAYRRQDKHAEALRTAERGRDLALKLFPDGQHAMAIFARAEYGRALAEAGDVAGGVEQLSLATRDAEKLYGPTARTVGFHLQNITQYHLQLGSIQAAVVSSTRAFDIMKEHAEPDTFNYAAALNAKTQALLAARRGEEALPATAQIQEAAKRLFGDTHPNAVGARASHALALGLSGRVDEGRALIDAVLADARRTQKPSARPFYIAGDLERLAGRHARALARAEEALALLNGGDGTAAELARVQMQVGLARVETGAAEAASMLDQALSGFRESQSEMTPAQADALVGRARLHLDAGRADEALPLLIEADQFWRDFDDQSRWAGEAALWLGRCLRTLGRGPEAADVLDRARRTLSHSPILNDRELVTRI